MANMFKMDALIELLTEAEYDFVSEFDVCKGCTFLAYLETDDVTPTIYYFESDENGYAHNVTNDEEIKNNAAGRMTLYSIYLNLSHNDEVYRAHLSIPSQNILI